MRRLLVNSSSAQSQIEAPLHFAAIRFQRRVCFVLDMFLQLILLCKKEGNFGLRKDSCWSGDVFRNGGIGVYNMDKILSCHSHHLPPLNPTYCSDHVTITSACFNLSTGDDQGDPSGYASRKAL